MIKGCFTGIPDATHVHATATKESVISGLVCVTIISVTTEADTPKTSGVLEVSYILEFYISQIRSCIRNAKVTRHPLYIKREVLSPKF